MVLIKIYNFYKCLFDTFIPLPGQGHDKHQYGETKHFRNFEGYAFRPLGYRQPFQSMVSCVGSSIITLCYYFPVFQF